MISAYPVKSGGSISAIHGTISKRKKPELNSANTSTKLLVIHD
jgi:hypothetical protein